MVASKLQSAEAMSRVFHQALVTAETANTESYASVHQAQLALDQAKRVRAQAKSNARTAAFNFLDDWAASLVDKWPFPFGENENVIIDAKEIVLLSDALEVKYEQLLPLVQRRLTQHWQDRKRAYDQEFPGAIAYNSSWNKPQIYCVADSRKD